MAEPAAFDPRAILRTLVARGADFVVIGGIAAVIHGSPRATFDLDISFAPDEGNLDALGLALTDLHGRLRGVPEDVPFTPDAGALRNVEVLTLSTDAGDLDLLRRPAGSARYGDLRARAHRWDLGGFAVLVASIGDLLEMKRAAGRPKDLADAAELETILRRTGA